mmetsp:Transcript_37271/g.106678  ORF Transcript_37271/g.106678 Transcript_37271/m.106678 type:complete len:329 (+) Transcript_37271:1487-2473(+)
MKFTDNATPVRALLEISSRIPKKPFGLSHSLFQPQTKTLRSRTNSLLALLSGGCQSFSSVLACCRAGCGMEESHRKSSVSPALIRCAWSTRKPLGPSSCTAASAGRAPSSTAFSQGEPTSRRVRPTSPSPLSRNSEALRNLMEAPSNDSKSSCTCASPAWPTHVKSRLFRKRLKSGACTIVRLQLGAVNRAAFTTSADWLISTTMRSLSHGGGERQVYSTNRRAIRVRSVIPQVTAETSGAWSACASCKTTAFARCAPTRWRSCTSVGSPTRHTTSRPSFVRALLMPRSPKPCESASSISALVMVLHMITMAPFATTVEGWARVHQKK